MSRRNLAVSLATLVLAVPALAQTRPPLLAVADGDSVRLYLTSPPVDFRGFVVYGGAPGTTLTKLTAEPVRPVTNFNRVGEVLQGDLSEILRITDTPDEAGLLRKLFSDPVAAGILTYTYPRAADMLGRRWSDGRRGRDTIVAYRLVYVDGAGQETNQSMTAQVVLRDVLPPAPLTLTAVERPQGVHAAWTYPAYRGGNDIAFGYNVYRAPAGEAPRRASPRLILRNEDRSPVFDDPAGRIGGLVTYTVRAVDILGREGPPSAPVTLRVTDKVAPPTPGQITATQALGRVTLNWPPVRVPDIRGYHVERGRSITQAFTRLTKTPLNYDAPSYVDSTVATSSQYFYRVVAVDSAGNERGGNLLSVIVNDDSPPPPPTDIRVTIVAGRRLRITWAASTAKDVLGYNVYRGMLDSPMSRANQRILDGRTFLDVGPDSIGMAPGRRYRVAVSAIDRSQNESKHAAIEVLVPDDDPPTATTGFNAANVLGREVHLSWSASQSLDVRGYAIERSADGGPKSALREIPVAAERELTDTAVVRGRNYVYWITTIDSAGNRGASQADTVKFADPTPPASPRNAYARVATPAGVMVAWERVIDLELAGYVVYRSDIATGTYVKLTPTPVTTLQWTDRTGTTELWYTVRAVDKSGNESAPSPAVRAPK